MEERQSKVPAGIVDAMQDVLGTIPERPNAVVLLSIYLFDVAKGLGLSEQDRDLDRIGSITKNHPARVLIKALLEDDPDGSCTEDDLASLLYAALLAVSGDASVRQKLVKNSPLNETDVRMLGQVYWNLFPAPGRDNLPIRPNTSAPGPNQRELGAYEAMTWNQRMEAGVKLHRGPLVRRGTIRRRGDRLAVLLANHLAGSHSNLENESIDAAFGYSEDGKIVSIRWREPRTMDGQATRTESSLHRELDEVDALRSLAEDGVSKGNHADAADFLELAVKILRRRSEQEIGDHEFRLALVSLEAGLASMSLGRLDEAFDHFQNVEKGALTLSALSPHSTDVGLGLAVALIGQGALHMQSKRFDLAEEVSRRAVATSQSLADQDSDAEIILALSLINLGTSYSISEQLAEATSLFARAEMIVRKLHRQAPLSHSFQVVLALTLLGLGQVLLFSDQEGEAQLKLEEALLVSTALGEGEQFRNEGRLLQATAVYMLALAGLALVLEQDDDHAVAEQLSVSDEELTKAILMLEELPNDHKTATLVSVIQDIRRGLLQLSAELEDD